MKKKIFIPVTVLAVTLLLLLTSCKTEYTGKSDIFSESDLQKAAATVSREMKKAAGVKNVYNIKYEGDETQTADNLDYCKSLAEAQNIKMDEFILFTADFTTGSNTNSLNPNDVYTDYEFYMCRQQNGEWIILTCGYG